MLLHVLFFHVVLIRAVFALCLCVSVANLPVLFDVSLQTLLRIELILCTR